MAKEVAMAAPKKDGKIWRHRIQVDGKRTSGTFDTKAAALAWEAEQRTAPAGGNATTQTCKDAFDRYEREVSKKKKGYRWEALRLNAFGRHLLGEAFGSLTLGEVRVRDIDATHIAAWRDTRLKSVQGETVNREMNLLSNVFTIARKEWKWITKSPTGDVSRPKKGKPRFRRVYDPEIEQMCVALGWREAKPVSQRQKVARAFLFALETAMRASEISALEESSVAGRVALVLDPKNGEDRDVPLSPRALELWNLDPTGFHISAASIDANWRTARDERTTVADLHFHDSRHEATTRLAKKLHVLALARVTGHKDIRKLMIYYNESAEDIAALL